MKKLFKKGLVSITIISSIFATFHAQGMTHLPTIITDSGKEVFIFSDINEHWAYSPIVFAEVKEIMNGYNNLLFKPNDNITRVEVGKTVSNYDNKFFDTVESGTYIPFEDQNSTWLTDSDWSTICINGYINGYSDNTFRPDDKMTRAEFIKVLYNMKKNEKNTPEVIRDSNFTDTTNHWAKDEIKYFADRGIINGYSSTVFNPEGFITRSEVAQLLQKFNGNKDIYIPIET